MNDYTHVTDTLEEIKHELNSQVENLEDLALSDFFGGGAVMLSQDRAKALIVALQQATNAINILGMDSLQLDIQEERMNSIRSDFDELHSAHILLESGNVGPEGARQLNNAIVTSISKIKSNL